MFLRTKLTMAGLMLSLTPFGVGALAQQPQKTNPPTGAQQPRRPNPMQVAMRRSPVLRVLRQLNLNDEQKQQARSIVRSSLQNTKAQRQELRPLSRQWREGMLTAEGLARANELHKQLIEAIKSMRAQLAGILTPEQKTKLEELIKTRRANHVLFGPRNQTPK